MKSSTDADCCGRLMVNPATSVAVSTLNMAVLP
jgi:hypothetical protein